jgi:peroxiredoxin Q/BCP
MLKVGQKAPLFVLKNQNDKDISLANLIGSKVFIWFFPRASTSGCTKEGIGLNDQINVFKKKKYFNYRHKQRFSKSTKKLLF